MMLTLFIGAATVLLVTTLAFMLGHIVHVSTTGNSKTIESKIATGYIALALSTAVGLLCFILGMLVRAITGY